MNFLGGYQFESNNEEDFIGKRSSWRNDAIRDGGGGVVSAEDIKPDNPSDNTVEVNETDYSINGGAFFDIYGGNIFSVYGGISLMDDSTNNTVIINGGIIDVVTGGTGGSVGIIGTNGSLITNSALVSGNTVTINGGRINGMSNGIYDNIGVIGGISLMDDSTNNTVNINGGKINGNIYGGWSNELKKVFLIISGDYVDVSGYPRISGNATGNTVNIKNGVINADIYGGYSDTENAKDNTVNIYDSPDLKSATLYGGYAPNGTSSGNTLNIYTKGLTAQNISDFQNIKFYLPKNTVNGDTILTLTDGKTDVSNTDITAVVPGGTTLTDGNIVNLIKNENGVSDIKSGTGELAEGVSFKHKLTVKRSVDEKRIILGIGNFVDGEEPTTPEDPTPSPVDDSYNTKNIYSSDSGTIYGGYTETGNAQNNTINLYGGTNLEKIYGGYAPNGSTSGNTLNVRAKNLTAQNIYNFSNINFYLPSSTVNGDTILTLTDSSTDISGAYVRAGVVGNANLNKGDVVTLLTNAGTITTTGTTYGKLTEGVSLTYDLTVSKSGNNKIIATIGNVTNSSGGGSSSGGSSSSSSSRSSNSRIVSSSSILNNANAGNISGTSNNGGVNPLESLNSNVTLNPQTKVLTVSRLPVVLPDIPTLPDLEPFAEFDLSFDGNTDGNFDVKTEISDAEETAEEKKETGVASTPAHKGWEIFADMGGGSMKYKTGDGSYVDTKTQNADLGFARSVGNMANKVTIAPVIDYQKSDFDSYLKDGTHGNGTTKYTGGGLVLRGMNHNGFYYEGSFRAGRAKTDFASDNLDTTGFFGRVTYDTTATVLNGHVKFGKYLRLNKNNILDVYSTYYHSHQGGSSADLSSGEHYDFSSADAGKVRIGYRLTTKTSRISQIYTGLAYQYDYNSGVTGNYKGYSTPSTKHSGSSGMIELGWQIRPLKNVPWLVDINATGWVGNQRGIKALAKVQKSF